MTAFHSGSIRQIGNAAFSTEAIKVASENHLFVEHSRPKSQLMLPTGAPI